MNLTLAQYIQGIRDKTFSPQEVFDHYLAKAQQEDKKYNAFISFAEDEGLKSGKGLKKVEKGGKELKGAKKGSKGLKRAEKLKGGKAKLQSLSRPIGTEHGTNGTLNKLNITQTLLKGAPIAIKDLILTQGHRTTCASKMLENYIPPYSATCIERLFANGGTMIGKTNCDQFGMGSSTENTIFGPTKNIYGTDRTAGGSSGGSAIAVAADMSLASLGTETGGSVRQPASLCNVVGLKPSYGRVSRYGVNALGSSFDQVGTFTKTVQDAKILLQTISGHDPRDATTFHQNDISRWEEALKFYDLKDKRIALPTQFRGEGLDEKVKQKIQSVISLLEEQGAIIEEIDFPLLSYGISMYYVLQTAEASTNLSRLDGLRYGLQKDTFKYDDIHEYYRAIRSEGFLPETKRRILTGTFVLNSENYEGYYLKAQKARLLLQQEFHKFFQQYDCMIGPTSPEVAWKLGDTSKKDDPVKMYLADIYTVTSNLAQNCAMSVPVGFVEDQRENMPVGIQIIADKRREDVLFGMGQAIETMLK